MTKPDLKTTLLGTSVIGIILFAFFGEGSLADTFFLIAGLIGIAAYYRNNQLKSELNKFQKHISERFEEVEYRLDKLEKRSLEGKS